MSTFSRLNRFDQNILSEIYNSGSVSYQIGDFNLFNINVNSANPNECLISIPLERQNYSVKNAEKLFDFEFSEFVDSSVNEQIEDEIRRAIDGDISLHKDKIIELRILANQGDSFSDFSDEFPYEALTNNNG